MKFIRFIVLLFSLPAIGLTPVLAQNTPLPNAGLVPGSPRMTHPEWFTCENDEDCMLARGGGTCEPVNKNYAQQCSQLLSEKYSYVPQRAVCAGRGPDFNCFHNTCEQLVPLL